MLGCAWGMLSLRLELPDYARIMPNVSDLTGVVCQWRMATEEDGVRSPHAWAKLVTVDRDLWRYRPHNNRMILSGCVHAFGWSRQRHNQGKMFYFAPQIGD